MQSAGPRATAGADFRIGEARLKGWGPRRGWDWCGAVLLMTLLLHVATVQTSGLAGLSLFQDDFYYYSKIAEFIASGHGSTFNGVVLTNGYHPLWMLVIVAITRVSSGLPAVIRWVEVLIALSTLMTYLLARRVLRVFLTRSVLVDLLALFACLCSLRFIRNGMEIVLTVPLGILLLSYLLRSPQPWTPRRTAGVCFLASLVILSRLDAVVLVGMLSLFLLSIRGFRKSLTWSRWVAVFLGFVPVLLYLASNEFYFGTLLPISGAAKQLRSGQGLSLLPLHSFYALNPLEQLPIVVSLAALLWLPFVRRVMGAVKRAVSTAALAFPIAHFLLVSALSDWAVWPWYFYSSLIALPLALGVVTGDLLRRFPRSVWMRKAACAALLLFCVAVLLHMLFFCIVLHGRVEVATRANAAEFVEKFASAHPGRYAMGDRAGIVAQLLTQPVIQTEGLVMDKDFLEHVRREDDLLTVLRGYYVRYYIASVRPDAVFEPCLRAVEPAQAGPDARHMAGTICQAPVETYKAADYTTLIYDLQEAGGG